MYGPRSEGYRCQATTDVPSQFASPRIARDQIVKDHHQSPGQRRIREPPFHPVPPVLGDFVPVVRLSVYPLQDLHQPRDVFFRKDEILAANDIRNCSAGRTDYGKAERHCLDQNMPKLLFPASGNRPGWQDKHVESRYHTGYVLVRKFAQSFNEGCQSHTFSRVAQGSLLRPGATDNNVTSHLPVEQGPGRIQNQVHNLLKDQTANKANREGPFRMLHRRSRK
jgi:hypothetical protein